MSKPKYDSYSYPSLQLTQDYEEMGVKDKDFLSDIREQLLLLKL